MTWHQTSLVEETIGWRIAALSPKPMKQRVLQAVTALVLCATVLACVPTSSGEFDTGDSPTTTGAEKLALVTGVSDGSISRISYVAKSQQYLISYQPNQISEKALAAAQERMCRFRRLSFDEIIWDRPAKFTANDAPAYIVEYYRTLRHRLFSCK